MRRGHTILVPVAMLVLLGLAIVGATAGLDLARLRPDLERQVAALTGRRLHLGTLAVRLLPRPALVATDAVLSGPPGGSVDELIVPRITASLPIWPLLRGRVEITQLVLDRPRGAIETGVVERSAEAAPPGIAGPLSVRSVLVGDGRLMWHDLHSDRTVELLLPNARFDFEGQTLHAQANWGAGGVAGTAVLDARVSRDRAGWLDWPADLTVSADPGDLLPARLDRLHVHLIGPDQPVALQADGTLRGTEARLSGSVSPGGAGSWNFDLAMQLGGAALTAAGRLAQPATLGGLHAAVTIRVPDLSTLSDLAGRPLPPVRDLGLVGDLSDNGDGLAKGASLDGVSLTSPAGELRGALALDRTGGRPALRVDLASGHLDLDALALPRPAIRADAPLPWALARFVDADLHLAADEIRASGVTGTRFALHLVDQAGQLRLDPATVQTPAGLLAGGAVADATLAEPRVTMLLRAPGLDVATLAAAAGLDGAADGKLDVDGEFNGTGLSPGALLASAAGHLGAKLVGGVLGGAVLDRVAALVPDGLGSSLPDSHGTVPLRCLAVLATARGGRATLPVLLLDAPPLQVTGTGQGDVGTGLVSAELQARLRTGPDVTGFSAALGGSWRAPTVRLGPPVDIPPASGVSDDACTVALGAVTAGEGGSP